MDKSRFYLNGAELRPFEYTRFGQFSHLNFWKFFLTLPQGPNGVYFLATILKEPKQLKNRKSVKMEQSYDRLKNSGPKIFRFSSVKIFLKQMERSFQFFLLARLLRKPQNFKIWKSI